MGVNYYVYVTPCEHCGHSDEEVYIGIAIAGYAFRFRTYKNIRSFQDWTKILLKAENRIKDEFGREMNGQRFIEMINARQHLRKNAYTPTKSDSDFLDDDGYDFSDYDFRYSQPPKSSEKHENGANKQGKGQTYNEHFDSY